MAAALSVVVSRHLLQLLAGYLRASGAVWLCTCLAIQFLATSAVWALGGRHELLPGLLLFVIGGMQAAPGRALAWQILPISRREMALAHWCAAAALPGCALSLALALALVSNHGKGWPAPSGASFLLQIAGIWSLLGYIAWLPLRTRFPGGYRGAALMLLTWGIPLLAGFYGYPLGPRGRLVSVPIMAAGCVLLLSSFLRASRGGSLPGAAVSATRLPDGAGTARTGGATRTGWRQLAPAVMRQTAMMLGLGLGGACLLRFFHPHATRALLWAFLISVAIWSALAGRRWWTQSLWCWRCLPLTLRRVTLAVEAVELLPLGVTLLGAWVAGRLAPQTALPLPGWLAAATLALVAMSNAWGRIARHAHSPSKPRYWVAFLAPLGYLGFVPAAQMAADQLHWLPALMWAGAAGLLIVSFRSTLTRMRSPENMPGLQAQRER